MPGSSELQRALIELAQLARRVTELEQQLKTLLQPQASATPKKK